MKLGFRTIPTFFFIREFDFGFLYLSADESCGRGEGWGGSVTMYALLNVTEGQSIEEKECS